MADVYVSQPQADTLDMLMYMYMYVRFPRGRGDLETEAPVLTLHGHDGAVVQVHDHAPGHGTSRLAHEVPSLGEEVQPVPGCGD